MKIYYLLYYPNIQVDTRSTILHFKNQSKIKQENFEREHKFC